MASDTYPVKEVAEKYDINIKTVYEAAKKGEIPSIRIGRRVIFPRAAIDRHLEGGKAA